MKGWRTIAWSAFLVTAGLVATLLAVVSPDMINYFIPAKYQPFTPLVIAFIGVVTGWLRYITTTPIGGNQ